MTLHYSMRMIVQISAEESFENRQELESFLRDHFEENNGVEIQVVSFNDINWWDDSNENFQDDEEIQLFWPEEDEPMPEWPPLPTMDGGEQKW